MGAWIEIILTGNIGGTIGVAPCVGAWIEIMIKHFGVSLRDRSLLAWERGLKLLKRGRLFCVPRSLLAWERGLKYYFPACCREGKGRSLRGSVD